MEKNKGFAILFAVLAIAILFITGAALLHLGFERRVYAIGSSENITARCAADAGLERAIFDLNKTLKASDLQIISEGQFPQADGVSLRGADCQYSYAIESSDPRKLTIESTGQSNEAVRKVRSIVELINPFDFALFADENLIIRNSVIIDRYNFAAGDPPLKIGTNSIAAGAIKFKTDATVKGDVVVGVDGDPSQVLLLGASVDIQGDLYPQSRSATLESVDLPKWFQTMPSAGTIIDNTVVNTDGKYDTIDLGNNEKLLIEGDVVLYVTGNITLDNGAQIEISDPGSSLILYLGGDLVCQNSSNINNLTKIARDFRLMALNSSNSIVLKNSAEIYGIIYAPDTDVILDNSADLYGSIIGKTVDLKNSVNVHYDTSLRDLYDVHSMLQYRIQRWYEN